METDIFFYSVLIHTLKASLLGLLLLVLFKSFKMTYRWKLFAWSLLLLKLALPLEVPTYLNPFHISSEIFIQEITIDQNQSEITETNYTETTPSETNEQEEVALEIIETQSSTFQEEEKSRFALLDILYLASILGLFIYTLIIRRNITKGINQEITLDPNIQQALKKIVGTKGIRIYASEQLGSPILLGIFNPIIIIPKTIATTWDTEKLTAIFKHEITHIKRKDHWLNLLLNFYQIIFWFNPFLTYLIKQNKKDIELACDETLSKDLSSEEKYHYGSTILEIIKMVKSQKTNSYHLTFNLTKNFTKERIKMLNNRYRQSFKKTILVLATISFLAFIAFTKNAPTILAGEPTETDSTIIKKSKKTLEEKGTFQWVELNLHEVLDELNQNYPSLSFVMDKKAHIIEKKNNKVNLKVNGLPLDSILTLLLSPYSLEYVLIENIIFITHKNNQNIKNKIVITTKGTSEKITRKLNMPVHFDFTNTELKEGIQELSELTGIKFKFETNARLKNERAAEKIIIAMIAKEMPLKYALGIILHNHGYTSSFKGDTLIIKKIKQMQTNHLPEHKKAIYTIRAITIPTQKAAKKLSDKLSNMGYKTICQSKTKRGYLITIGLFTTRAEAIKTLKRLTNTVIRKVKPFSSAYIVNYSEKYVKKKKINEPDWVKKIRLVLNTQGTFHWEKQTLGEVLDELEKYYPTITIVKNEKVFSTFKLNEKTISHKFNHQPLKNILLLLLKPYGFKLVIHKKSLHIANKRDFNDKDSYQVYGFHNKKHLQQKLMKPVHFDFTNTGFKEGLSELSELTGINLYFSRGLFAKKTLDPDDLIKATSKGDSFKKVLDQITAKQKCTYEIKYNSIIILRLKTYKLSIKSFINLGYNANDLIKKLKPYLQKKTPTNNKYTITFNKPESYLIIKSNSNTKKLIQNYLDLKLNMIRNIAATKRARKIDNLKKKLIAESSKPIKISVLNLHQTGLDATIIDKIKKNVRPNFWKNKDRKIQYFEKSLLVTIEIEFDAKTLKQEITAFIKNNER